MSRAVPLPSSAPLTLPLPLAEFAKADHQPALALTDEILAWQTTALLAREIARLTPLYSKFFTCCIDLDKSALNTFGNALQTRRWARDHNRDPGR